MKLFITNKSVFEQTIENECEQNTNCINSHLIHKKAFTELNVSVSSKDCIPLNIMVDIDYENFIVFVFQSKKNDVYYYEFQTN